MGCKKISPVVSGLISSMGFTTVLTLSGVTQEADLDQFGYAPDFIIKSVKDLLNDELFARVLDKQHEPVLNVA